MPERLSSADVAFLYLERRTTPQHVGGLAIFTAPDGFDYDRLVRLLEERISLAPRYRQKLRNVPANLANPVWVDDPSFDITYHVRRSALPRPGTDAALLEFCARIQSRLLDRDRPLWEMYLVEGLRDDRVAVSPRPTRPWSTGTAASTSPRCCWTSRPSRGAPSRRCGCPSASRPRLRLAADAVRRRRPSAGRGG